MELEWLKKKSERSPERLRPLIEPDHPALSVRRQCELLGLSRSSLYYEAAAETAENLRLMRLIDGEYAATPSSAAGGWRSGWSSKGRRSTASGYGG